jgi:hypothetical protein
VTAPTGDYAARLAIDYREPLDRLTTALRIVWAIPICIVLVGITSTVRGTLFLPILLMIVFRQKYPRWWFDWNLQLSRFSARVLAYLALLTDTYPSTEEEQGVHLDLDYPDVPANLNRWLPLVKWLLAIPHFIVLAVLALAAIVCVLIAWVAILFTGRYPQGLFNFVVGVGRWGLRVEAYALLLITDRYPPFSLDPA